MPVAGQRVPGLTDVLCLVRNEGQVKLLLLLYKRLIQPYLSLLRQ